LLVYKDKRYGIFHVGAIYLALSLIDTYIPSIIWITGNQSARPPWLAPFSNSEISLGLINYTIFYSIMILTLMLFPKANIKKWIGSYNIDNIYLKKKLHIFLIITGCMFLIQLMYEINSFGGYSEWLFQKFSYRFNKGIKTYSLLERFLYFIPWRNLFDTLVYIFFLYRYRFRNPKIYGIILPIISIVFSLTTSHRGSILLFLIGLFFVESIRMYIHKKNNYDSSYGVGRESLFKPKYFILSIMIIGAFLLYGAFRTALENEAKGNESTGTSVIYSVLNQGSGLQGISSVIKRYGNDLDFLLGKTYIDMILLPIPRSIYTSKPITYGIQDISLDMGWTGRDGRVSNEAAITLPGEAYANFGWFGLAIALLYGIFFGLIIRFIHNMGGIYIALYPTVVIPVIFMSNWMSFTGTMNRLLPSLIIFFMLFIISIKIYKTK